MFWIFLHCSVRKNEFSFASPLLKLEGERGTKLITCYLTKQENLVLIKELNFVGKPFFEEKKKKKKSAMLLPTKIHNITICTSSCSYDDIFLLIDKSLVYGPWNHPCPFVRYFYCYVGFLVIQEYMVGDVQFSTGLGMENCDKLQGWSNLEPIWSSFGLVTD